jgi:indoleamine 2,3-dioxygenase
MSVYYKKKYTDKFFNVSAENGFLPVKDPLITLPADYYDLQTLINDLPPVLKIADEIEERVREIPDYSNLIRGEKDVFVLQALYRAYTFITSGYTLELAYQEFVKSGNYGVARQRLPANIAKPLVLVSNKLEAYPWLDYHYAYSLGNYVKKNEQGFDTGRDDLHWTNLNMACKFTGGSDEIGFIMVHVYINELSPKLVKTVMDYGKGDNDANKILGDCGKIMEEMNVRRREMWQASRYEHYNDFRIFIMGITGNDSIFGDGLVYEGCYDDKPQKFRGQTGAQDNIIPMIDIFTGIVDYYPDNQLTKYLLDLRSYRPKCIQNFFVDLRKYYQENPILETLKKNNDVNAMIKLLKIVDEVYLFRNGHWQFVQKYIMSNTKYAFATGGTPITTWLINQIECVLEYERVIIGEINKYFVNQTEIKEDIEMFNNLEEGYKRRIQLLNEQVNELNKNNYNIELVYGKNNELNLDDTKL